MKTKQVILAALVGFALTVGLTAQAQAAGSRRGGNDRSRSAPTDRAHHSTSKAPPPGGRPEQIGGGRQEFRGRSGGGTGPRVPSPRGHGQRRLVTVLVEPGHWQWQRTPARYVWLNGLFGRGICICVQREQLVRVWVPDRYECRTVQVWVQH